MTENNSHNSRFDQDLFQGAQSPTPIALPEQPDEIEFPIEALGEILSDFALELSEAIQAPKSLCAQSVLAAVNLAVQAHADVQLDSMRVPLSLFFNSLALSGDRKTSLDKIVLAPHEAYQRSKLPGYSAELRKFQEEKAKYEKEKAKSVFPLNLTPPAPPIHPLFVHTDFTVEGLLKHISHGYPSNGCFASEGGIFVGGHGMRTESKTNTAATLSCLWDGRDYLRTRATSDLMFLQGKRLSMHLMIQPGVAKAFITDELLNSQGLLARMLTIFPKSRIGSRTYAPVSVKTSTAFRNYEQKIKSLYDRPLRFLEGSAHELDPVTIELDEGARQIWIDYHNGNESQMRPGASRAGLKSFASKVPELVLRIAGTLSVFENPTVRSISERHVASAIRLADYYVLELQRILSHGIADEEIDRAKLLLNFILAREEDMITAKTILQYGPQAIRKRDLLDQAAQILEDYGWLERKRDSLGRTTVAEWRIIRSP